MGDLWRPVLCVSILGFSWKLIAGIEPAQSSGGAAVLVGFAAAALLVVALELFLSKGFDILHICQVLFPALTVVFLLPSLFGQQYTTLLVAFLMFGFEVVNLLLIITCAVYTIRNGLPSSPLYALCIGPVLLSMAVGSGLAELLGRRFPTTSPIGRTSSCFAWCCCRSRSFWSRAERARRWPP